MKIRNLKLFLENFLNGGHAILTEVRPAYEYKDGKRIDTKVIGKKVTVAFDKNGYDTLTVTVADPVDNLSVLLDRADAPVYVEFQGFTARIYTMNGTTGISAKADSVQVVDDSILDI